MATIIQVVNDPADAHLADDPAAYLADVLLDSTREARLLAAAEERQLGIERRQWGGTRWTAIHGTPAEIVALCRALDWDGLIRTDGAEEAELVSATGWRGATSWSVKEG